MTPFELAEHLLAYALFEGTGNATGKQVADFITLVFGPEIEQQLRAKYIAAG